MDAQTFQIIKKKPQMATQGAVVLGAGALLVGFEDCLFNPSTADACVSHASGMVEKFQAVGDHLIAWATAIMQAAF